MLTRRAFAATGLLALSSQANAQGDPAQAFFNENRYLPYWRTLSGSQLAQFAAFLGDETTALANAADTRSDALPADARAEAAIPAILEAARGRRIVILNEAHVASRHRSFLAHLLRALRPLGFTHLAAETSLNAGIPEAPDITAFKSGETLNPLTGYYTRDPVFAEAVREAADLGYGFVSYEMTPRQAGAETEVSEDESIARREEAQADNFIANALDRYPEGRYLVYVGYSHLREAPDHAGRSWFARRLANKTGIDALTIEQSLTGSFGPHGADSPLAQQVLARFAPRAAIVVRTADAFVGAARMGADLAVLHPASPELRRRPGWLARDPARRFVHIAAPRRRDQGPVLVQAIHAHDPELAIPADQVLLGRGHVGVDLLLRPGRYRLRVETLEGFENVRDLTVPN